MIVVLMGVCGIGKTVVGKALSKDLKVEFRDADEFHSTENKNKMSQGIPLTDEDRLPWLQAINKYILHINSNGSSGVLTCSALKKKYRKILMENCVDQKGHSLFVRIVYLKGTEQYIQQRLENRSGHFMPPTLLKSQLLTLEEPDSDESYCITVNTDNLSVSEIVKNIVLLLENLSLNK